MPQDSRDLSRRFWNHFRKRAAGDHLRALHQANRDRSGEGETEPQVRSQANEALLLQLSEGQAALNARLDVLTATLATSDERHAAQDERIEASFGRLQAGVDRVMATQAELIAPDGPLAQFLADETDRLDGYLVYHAQTAATGLAELQGQLTGRQDPIARAEAMLALTLQRTTVLEEAIAVTRAELATFAGHSKDWTTDLQRGLIQVVQRTIVLEQAVAATREEALAASRASKRSYLGHGLDSLLMLQSREIVVPAEEPGLLVFLLRHGSESVEPGVQRLIAQRLTPGSVAVDVGANIGLLTLCMADAVGSEGHVWSFEPVEHLANALRRTVQINDFAQRVSVKELALDEADGKVTFHRALHGPLSSFFPLPEGHASEERVVAAKRLDDCLPAGSRVDLVKLDVEGGEPRVWRGMQRVLADNPQVVLIMEWSASHFTRSGENAKDFLLSIEALGFSAAVISDDASDVGEPAAFDPARLENANVVFTRGGPKAAKPH